MKLVLPPLWFLEMDEISEIPNECVVD
jgi:hypothetical protein